MIEVQAKATGFRYEGAFYKLSLSEARFLEKLVLAKGQSVHKFRLEPNWPLCRVRAWNINQVLEGLPFRIVFENEGYALREVKK